MAPKPKGKGVKTQKGRQVAKPKQGRQGTTAKPKQGRQGTRAEPPAPWRTTATAKAKPKPKQGAKPRQRRQNTSPPISTEAMAAQRVARNNIDQSHVETKDYYRATSFVGDRGGEWMLAGLTEHWVRITPPSS